MKSTITAVAVWSVLTGGPCAVAGAAPAAVGDTAGAVGEKTKQAVLSFGDDMRHLPRHIWEDVQALPDWKNAAALALGAGFAAYAREDRWDDDVRRDVRNHPDRFGRTANDVLDIVASGYTFYALSAATYGASLFVENERLHDFSLDMVSALTMELPVVFAMKKAFHTRRPNGGSDGFPSGHMAAAASFGALLNRYYGPYAGAAGSAFAGIVAFHRIDARKHDLSDVIFGAALGYVAGRTAGSVDELPLLKAQLLPLESEQGARGLRLEWRF